MIIPQGTKLLIREPEHYIGNTYVLPQHKVAYAYGIYNGEIKDNDQVTAIILDGLYVSLHDPDPDYKPGLPFLFWGNKITIIETQHLYPEVNKL